MARDWDRLAATYRAQESLERPSLEAVVELGDPGPRDLVVDLACGPGTLGRQFARADRSVNRLVGVDASPSMLRRAAAAGAEPVLGDVREVPLGNAVADLVVCSYLLHLVDAPTRVVVMGEVARLLAPRGRAVIVVPARPGSTFGRVTRWVLRRTIARGTLAVVDLGPAITSSGLAVTVDRHVGAGRWGYEARVVRLAHPPTTEPTVRSEGPERG